jgi:hypothetical protein
MRVVLTTHYSGGAIGPFAALACPLDERMGAFDRTGELLRTTKRRDVP